MYYVGLDIHKAFTLGVIKDKEGNELRKEKFENTSEEFDLFLDGFPSDKTEIVMESTCIWEYLYEMLESKGYKVKLANPLKTKAIAYAKIKTDAIDASTLADLLRANLVAESYIPKKDKRDLREVVRQRKAIVKGRTQIKNKIHAILMRRGIKIPYASLCPRAISLLKETIDSDDMMNCYLGILKEQNNQLRFIDKNIEKLSNQNSDALLLKTIPGIGSIRSMEIIAEIAEINRFSDAASLCCFAGLVPSIKQSGNTLRFGRLIKQANHTLKNALIESSWIAVRTKEMNPIKFHYLRLKDAKGKQRAICATARKMLCIIYAMLKKKEEFRA